jgi:mannose-6-phosphate isomerase-like protein (cupin superfamily)
MDIEVMEGFEPPQDFTAKVLDTTFHFWTRGFPEIIRYGDGLTRFTHGADITVFYYQPGLRSGWASLKKGMHANEDPKSQVNEFPSLFIILEGKGNARIGGNKVELQKGEAIFVPKNVAHEFWNDNNEPFELVLIMFGEGA